MRHPEEGRAPSLTPNLVYATILEFHAAPNSRLSELAAQKLIQTEVQPARFQDKNMDNPNTQRRSIGLLVIFATVLTLIAVWNLPETPSAEGAVSGPSV